MLGGHSLGIMGNGVESTSLWNPEISEQSSLVSSYILLYIR